MRKQAQLGYIVIQDIERRSSAGGCNLGHLFARMVKPWDGGSPGTVKVGFLMGLFRSCHFNREHNSRHSGGSWCFLYDSQLRLRFESASQRGPGLQTGHFTDPGSHQ